MRGEHLRREEGGLAWAGSSPHARGAQPRPHLSARVAGIIPACAGSTVRLVVANARRRDHSRMRGEHACGSTGSACTWGSSPHARGAHGLALVAARIWGIIPACAGSTLRHRGEVRRAGDHPRMRGEHAGEKARNAEGGGSSPHARGARLTVPEIPFSRRIIPACAGSTRTICKFGRC